MQNYDELQLDINIDGIPLFKSSRVQLWPILCRIINTKEKLLPFAVGLYIDNKKPNCVKDYLKDFVDEVHLLIDSLVLNGKKINLKFRCLTCEAPAKAFICGVPGHSSSDGCTKCTQVAKKIDNVLTYSSFSGTPISDVDFALRKYPKQHSNIFKKEKTPLEEIGFDMISQTPLDSMHLVDLGVMRKMLIRITQNKTQQKTSKKNISAISSGLIKLRNFFPKEFPRKPRGLDDLHHWKATEFHQFLAYSGIIVLNTNVHEDIFYEVLILHNDYRLLCSPRHVESNID